MLKNLIIYRTLEDEAFLRIGEVQKLLKIWGKWLFDDFSRYRDGSIWECVELAIEHRPYFWTFQCPLTREFMGFAYLYDLVGDEYEGIYSANITICFAKKFWGAPVKRACGRLSQFLFEDMKITKLGAQVYEGNYRCENLLKAMGFEFEGTMKAKTLVGGQCTDIKIWGLMKGKNNYEE